MAEEVQEKEEKILDEKEFLVLAEKLRQKLVESKKLTGEGKKCSITVLDAIVNSVKVHGARQHGLTKEMLKVAMTVYGKLAEDKRRSEDERAVLKALVFMTIKAIQQN